MNKIIDDRKPWFILIWVLAILAFDSCESKPHTPQEVLAALEQSGKNRAKLDSVINHFVELGDEEELNSAYYLIIHMMNKKFINPNQGKYALFLENIDAQTIHSSMESISDSLWNLSVNPLDPNPLTIASDLDFISANFIIDNIQSAYATWRSAPWHQSYSMGDFNTYILPYRNVYDVPSPWRNKISTHFDIKVDSSRNMSETISEINKHVGTFGYWPEMAALSHMKVSDVYKIMRGSCRHQSNLKIALLRDQGIPCVQVTALMGTEWVAILDKNKELIDYGSYFLPDGSKFYKKRYRWWPKVYIQDFSNKDNPLTKYPSESIPAQLIHSTAQDVTAQFSIAANIEIQPSIAPPIFTELLYLRVLDDNRWRIADWAEIKQGKAQFKQMGVGNVYFPFYHINGRFYTAGEPFYINLDQSLKWFDVKNSATTEIKVSRKCALNMSERIYSQLMVGATIEGSHDSTFKQSKVLATITTAPTFMETLFIDNQEAYKYYRFRSDTLFGISEFSFFDTSNRPMNGRYICSENMPSKDIKLAFDGNIRTNLNNDNGSLWSYVNSKITFPESPKKSWFGLALKKPTVLKKVQYLSQNSFNAIEIGDNYELFYWKNGRWNTLGSIIADDIELKFKAPENALLLLKNHSRGKEEVPFFMKEGKQIFSGWH